MENNMKKAINKALNKFPYLYLQDWENNVNNLLNFIKEQERK